jgi:hypothetical protein
MCAIRPTNLVAVDRDTQVLNYLKAKEIVPLCKLKIGNSTYEALRICMEGSK